MFSIKVTKSKKLKPKPRPSELKFGELFTDHLFILDYNPEKEWHHPRIEPYKALSLDPACCVFHYGQSIFEGIKAYRTKQGIHIFRPQKYLERFNNSAERMCIPPLDSKLILECLKKLLRLEKNWIPTQHGTALYVRPLIISTGNFLGVRISQTYRLMIMLSPVGAYYAEGFQPVKIFVSEEHVRAVRGGVGFAKTCGNYAASLYPGEKARLRGFTQVLYLDAIERKYIEEVGTMNIFFVIEDTLITPPLTGSILPGITRDSILSMVKDLGIKTEERMISIDEVIEASRNNRLKEVFGSGTAAVVSPVSDLSYRNQTIRVNQGRVGPIAQRLFDEITAIQYRTKPDPYGWIEEV